MLPTPLDHSLMATTSRALRSACRWRASRRRALAVGAVVAAAAVGATGRIDLGFEDLLRTTSGGLGALICAAKLACPNIPQQETCKAASFRAIIISIKLQHSVFR